MDQHEKLLIDNRWRFKFAINTFKKDWEMDIHYHKALEISYSIKGTKRQWIDDEEYSIDNDDLLIVNSSCKHKIDCDKGRIGLMIIIESDYMKELCPDYNEIMFNMNRDLQAVNKIKEILKHLYERYKDKDVWIIRESDEVYYKRMDYDSIENIYVMSKIDEIVYILSKYLKEPKDKRNRKYEEKAKVIKVICDYLHTHYKDKIDLNDLASKLNYNRTYLSTFFKSFTGITIYEYLTNYRLEKSLKYLLESDDTIVSIANYVGFSDIKSFNTKFKQVYQLTPSEYRKKHK